MKKSIIALSILSAFIIQNAKAEYVVTIKLNGNITMTEWAESSKLYGDWSHVGVFYDCSNWTPKPESVTTGLNFTQTATDCKQLQERTVQNQEIDKVSGKIRNVGQVYNENQIINIDSERSSIGLLETWNMIVPIYGNWTNTGGIYDCLTWTPDSSTITINTAFTQTSNDCKQNQNRSVQNREQETTTLEIRNKDVAIIESQFIASSSTRASTGTKETWIPTTPSYGTWTNSGAVYGCTNWTPAASTGLVGTTVNQTATNCSVNQTRTVQAREIETTIGTIRNVGSTTNESTVATGQTGYQSVAGTTPTVDCRNDDRNNFQVVPIPQNGGITQVYVIWDGATKYSQQHNGGQGLTEITGIDGGRYYRTSTGVGRFSVCKR